MPNGIAQELCSSFGRRPVKTLAGIGHPPKPEACPGRHKLEAGEEDGAMKQELLHLTVNLAGNIGGTPSKRQIRSAVVDGQQAAPQ